jgi:hypothetical protein
VKTANGIVLTNENVIIGNNETIKICMNDEIMEENVSVQTKTNKTMKINL